MSEALQVTPIGSSEMKLRCYPRDVLHRDAILERIMQGLLREKPAGYVAEIDKDEGFITVRGPEPGRSA